MGIVYLKVKLINPAHSRKKKECDFLVESGAVYSVVPAEVLRKLGIKPSSFQEFILANGEIIKRPIGNAFFEYQGKIRAAPVVFGDKGIYLLGATTLEALGLMLDPIRRELKPLPMVLMQVKKIKSSSHRQ